MRVSKVKPVSAVSKTANKKNPYVFDPKTDKVKLRKPTPVAEVDRRAREVFKRETPYLSEIDPAVIIHSNKTHRSVSEAFRDAEYACAIITFKTDAMLTWDFLKNMFMGMFICSAPLFFLWVVISAIYEAIK